MYPKAFLVALLSLALSVHALPHNKSGGKNTAASSSAVAAASSAVADTCAADAVKTVTVTQTAGAAAATTLAATPNAGKGQTGGGRGNQAATNPGRGGGRGGNNANNGQAGNNANNGQAGNNANNGQAGNNANNGQAGNNANNGQAGNNGQAAAGNNGQAAAGNNGQAAAGNNANGNGAAAGNNAGNGAAAGNNAGNGNNNANAGNGNNAAAGGNAQTSLTIDPSNIFDKFASDGGADAAAGQEPSITSTNNFINFCVQFPGVAKTNGQQVIEGSCNQTPMGLIAAQAKMPSAKFQSPANGATVAANQDITIQVAINNLETGHFTNPTTTFHMAPQQLNAQGLIKGHSHVVIEQLTSLDQKTPTDPTKFVFFKGLNDKAQNGILTTTVPGGLPAGTYRIATINSSSNHQPALVAVAQRGALDDMAYFTVSANGQAAGGNNNGQNGNNNAAAGNNNAAAGQNGANAGQNAGANAGQNAGQNAGANAGQNAGANRGAGRGGRRQRRF
ncbi:hypothetical protein C8Q74DRAFT_1442269 [Fomes fomentarius]|nr:hypothetical protein C8Q74DRAFT_1442269 [Fomes fomentarius]